MVGVAVGVAVAVVVGVAVGVAVAVVVGVAVGVAVAVVVGVAVGVAVVKHNWLYFFAGFGMAMLFNHFDQKYGYAVGLAIGNFVRIFIQGK